MDNKKKKPDENAAIDALIGGSQMQAPPVPQGQGSLLESLKGVLPSWASRGLTQQGILPGSTAPVVPPPLTTQQNIQNTDTLNPGQKSDYWAALKAMQDEKERQGIPNGYN